MKIEILNSNKSVLEIRNHRFRVILISTNFQTQSPNNGKRKDYLKVRKFLNGRTEVSMTNDQSDNIRNYQNVKNWVLSEAEDLNQSKPLKQSSPKQFNRASEWIRQKGRLKEVE